MPTRHFFFTGRRGRRIGAPGVAIVDGKALLDKGEVAGIGEAEVRREFRSRALALRDRSLDRRNTAQFLVKRL
jgi:hypothetical protein